MPQGNSAAITGGDMSFCKSRFFLAVCVGLLIATASPWSAGAQNYPEKPIKIILGFGAGAPPDIASRRLTEVMAPILGQTFFIESKPGAGGVLGMDFVAKSPPDGYTLAMGTLGTHVFNVSLYKSLPYDPVNDFVPITRVVSGGFNTFLVNPD